MKHVFTRILGIEVSFTTTVEDFIKHSGPKITYTKQPLQNEFFIRSNALLFEQGINDIEIKIENWEELPCFFEAGERSNIPFDIFSAIFYLISRYEEYLPHVKDELGRFPVKESLAYQNDFLKRPLVDLWAKKFLVALKERFPEIEQTKKKYQFTSIINVTTSHCFAYRSFIRTIGGILLDLSKFRLLRLFKRVAVWLSPRKDPYNNFTYLMNLHKEVKCKTMFFFQFADYSKHDKNVSIYKNKFRYLIKSVADYSIVSLSASYSSSLSNTTLKEEKSRLANLINRPVSYSRMRYNRVHIPKTYQDLVETEFTDDYTMGYTHEIGFRAGTCTPFYFYDINLEVQQPIKVHPFAVCDYSFLKFKKQAQVFEVLDAMYRETKEVQGNLNIVFSNELLGSSNRLKWLELYRAILKRYYV
ncbi:polysaccharide deacetylase family protein [uncultured Croceitalea sp.]|uniref:polysaccharide deacetylase family protein n=1 Tax=uncultured Croceitalea sp. TaxID=1798908 RepID=UPI0033057F1D